MEQKMAVITKRAYHAKKIGTVQYTNEQYDDKDSGWRLFFGDEDDHVLDRMECFQLITLEEALSILPGLKDILDKTACTYYHYNSIEDSFTESDDFASADAPESDPFMQAFMRK